MSRQTVQKQGVHSGSKKAASTRHPFESAPSTSPTPGAFGKEAGSLMPHDKERKGKSRVKPSNRRGNAEVSLGIGC
jgi:hypothetical protein